MKAFFRAILKFLREADIFLLAVSIISTIFGIILISSVGKNNGAGSREVYIQIISMVIGIVLFVLFSYLDIDIIAEKFVFLLIFSVLFISTLLIWGVGEEETGNRAWLRFYDIGIQPAEIVKIIFIIVIAKMTAGYMERRTLNSFGSLLQVLAVFLMMFGMLAIITKDIGSALVYGFIFIVMMYIAGVKLRWFLIGGGFVAALFPLIWNYYLRDNYGNRILAPFQRGIDPTGRNIMWQQANSVYAISTGGFLGQGLGKGKFTQGGMIPIQSSDFIFSAAGEELGFVGCLLIVILITVIIVRCVQVGIKSNNPLGMLVCTGVAAMLIAHTLENIGMCLGLLPVVGIPLPFFSYGGSSMITCMAAMGIVSGIKMRPKPVRFRNL
jgi:rod shape determining protein RodA